MIQNLFQYCTFFMKKKRTLYVEGTSVRPSVCDQVSATKPFFGFV